MAARNRTDDKRLIGNSGRLRRLRQAVQLLALLLFLYLLLGTRQGQTTHLPHDLFFRLDLLVGFTAMVAGQSWMPTMVLGGSVLLITLVIGRGWCSWICPLGTLLDLTKKKHTHQNNSAIQSGWRQVKYVLLVTILLAAAWGSLTLLVLDPTTLLFRTVASVVLPGLSLAVTTVETRLFGITPIQPAVEWFDTTVREPMSAEQPFFLLNILLLLVFAGVIALNGISERFWCRYICPLGGLLGLISSAARIKQRVDREKCTSCRLCAKICPTGAIDAGRNYIADSTECTSCLDCMVSCPTGAISFGAQSQSDRHQNHDPQRRQLLTGLGAATIGAALLYVAPNFHRGQPSLIRPPGASEGDLLKKCIRCGECTRVCPTGVIQPSYSLAEWDGLLTPALQTRLSYCDYSCTLCGQVCPTGAIAKLSLKEKQNTVIGIAHIDKKRCIPYAQGRDCIVCEEMCPVAEKAVKLDEKTVVHPTGEVSKVLLPRVIPDLCIGCGICEYKCPVDGEAAIRIYTTDVATT